MSTVHTRAQLKLDEGYKLIVQEITSTGDFATCIQLKPLSEINRMLVEADPAGFKYGDWDDVPQAVADHFFGVELRKLLVQGEHIEPYALEDSPPASPAPAQNTPAQTTPAQTPAQQAHTDELVLAHQAGFHRAMHLIPKLDTPAGRKELDTQADRLVKVLQARKRSNFHRCFTNIGQAGDPWGVKPPPGLPISSVLYIMYFDEVSARLSKW